MTDPQGHKTDFTYGLYPEVKTEELPEKAFTPPNWVVVGGKPYPLPDERVFDNAQRVDDFLQMPYSSTKVDEGKSV